MTATRVTVWALYGYENQSDFRMGDHSCACYAMERSALPFGGWTGQGCILEAAVQIEVAVGSFEHRAAGGTAGASCAAGGAR